MWTFPFDYTDLRVRNARLPTFTSLESWNWRSRNSLLVQKGQRTALFLRLRSFSILRIFSLSFFFSYFFPIILYRVFFPRLWASFDTIIFLLLFPTRFILFYFFFFILIPAEVTIEAHMFSEPFVLRCFTTETSYKQEKLVLSFSHFSFKKVSRILPDESWFLTAKDQRSYKLKFKSYIQKMYR